MACITAQREVERERGGGVEREVEVETNTGTQAHTHTHTHTHTHVCVCVHADAQTKPLGRCSDETGTAKAISKCSAIKKQSITCACISKPERIAVHAHT